MRDRGSPDRCCCCYNSLPAIFGSIGLFPLICMGYFRWIYCSQLLCVHTNNSTVARRTLLASVSSIYSNGLSVNPWDILAFGFVLVSWPLEAFSRCAFGGSAVSALDLGASSMNYGTLMDARAMIFPNCTTKFDISVFSFSFSAVVTSATAFTAAFRSFNHSAF